MTTAPNPWTVAALYRFTPIADVDTLRADLKIAFEALGICGSLLIAPEGINGTLAGPSSQSVDAMLSLLQQKCGLPRDVVKFSTAPTKPFTRLKVRKKREIITFNQPAADPNVRVGQYVKPNQWNDLLRDPDVLLLDTRNTYETRLGVFEGAVVPPIDQFTDFAAFVREKLAAHKNNPVAMYCTGGIRCEKASAFMLAEGFSKVYHLEGGILKYLEEIPEADSKWQGDCYVFDKRMAVGHGLKTGNHFMCFSCGAALTEHNKQHPQFEEGVACEFCFTDTSDDDKARFRMRHAQLKGQMTRDGTL